MCGQQPLLLVSLFLGFSCFGFSNSFWMRWDSSTQSAKALRFNPDPTLQDGDAEPCGLSRVMATAGVCPGGGRGMGQQQQVCEKDAAIICVAAASGGFRLHTGFQGSGGMPEQC